MFKSKRKGTVSVRILIPSRCSEKVLSENFWPKFIHCKLWQQNERTPDSADQNDKSTLSGTTILAKTIDYTLDIFAPFGVPDCQFISNDPPRPQNNVESLPNALNMLWDTIQH